MEAYLSNLTVFNHPLIKHKVSHLCDVNTGTKEFSELVKELAMLMGYETLKELLADYPRFAGEVEKLKAQAELGERALKELREDVVRLAALADPQAEMKVLQSMAQHLEEPELRQLQRLYGQKAAKNYPLQLPYAQKPQSLSQEDGAFLI